MKDQELKMRMEFGVQLCAPRQFLNYNIEEEKSKWGVRKLKRHNFNQLVKLLMAWVMIWAVFGIYYGIMVYPQAMILLGMLMLLGWMCSYVFDRKD